MEAFDIGPSSDHCYAFAGHAAFSSAPSIMRSETSNDHIHICIRRERVEITSV
jgi:hypothetical protein